MDRERWRLFCHRHPLWDISREDEVSDTIEYDRIEDVRKLI